VYTEKQLELLRELVMGGAFDFVGDVIDTGGDILGGVEML